MNVAILENNKVVNVVVGTPEVVASLFKQTAPVTETTGNAWIGARWNGKKFEPMRIHASWILNEKTFDYDPPKPKPEGDYYWSEADLDWLPVPEPVELDPETGLPIAPTEVINEEPV